MNVIESGAQMEPVAPIASQPSICIEFGRTAQPEASYLVTLYVAEDARVCEVYLHRRAHSAVDALLDVMDQYFEAYKIQKIKVRPMRSASTTPSPSELPISA